MEANKSIGEVTRETQISHQMAKQGKAITALEDITVRLSTKLEQITTQSAPAISAEKEEENLVPFADNLRCYNNRIKHIADNLDSVINRIELCLKRRFECQQHAQDAKAQGF